MKRITLLVALFVLTVIVSKAQIQEMDGLTGLFEFADTGDLFGNTAGVGSCDGVMEFDPDATDPSFDDMPATNWEVTSGINDNAISLAANTWFKIWHGINANGGGDYVNEFTIVIDIRVSDETSVYSLLEVNPTPSENGYTSELEIDNMRVGSVGAPASGEDELGFSDETLTANTWYRIVYAPKLSEGIYVYVDGELWREMEGDFTDARPAPYSANNDPDDAAFKVGGHNEVDRDASKEIDMVAVFNRTLSAGEIADLGGAGSFVGINYLHSENSIKIYPNPANDILNISTTNAANLEIINVSGQIVKNTLINKEASSVDISLLSKGIYFVKVTGENGNTTSQKLIIE